MKKCFCGCKDFYVTKPDKHFVLVCQACDCKRKIVSPGVAVEEYGVRIPFVDELDSEDEDFVQTLADKITEGVENRDVYIKNAMVKE